ncbi:hypothetical protein Tco_0166173, partial [Tanacetum coccineum]
WGGMRNKRGFIVENKNHAVPNAHVPSDCSLVAATSNNNIDCFLCLLLPLLVCRGIRFCRILRRVRLCSLVIASPESNLKCSFCLLLSRMTMATTSDLDIMQKSKGKMIMVEPEIISVADLKPTHYSKTIEVTIYRKWTSRHIRTRQSTKYCCMLI